MPQPRPAPEATRTRSTGEVALGDDTLDLFTADADWMATVSRPDQTPEVHPEPAVDPAAPVDEPTPQETAEPVEPADEHEGHDAPEVVVAPRTQLPPQVARTPRTGSKRTRGRASVPSWDEIMFGGGK